MFSSMNVNLTPISRDHNKKLVKIIQTLLSYEQSNIFRKPIPHKSLGWDDYKQIVKRPIDLNLIRRQYNEGKYKFVQQVLDQIQLTWDNVFLYGKRQHQSFDSAIRMQKYFDQLLNDLFPQYYEKINRVLYFRQFENQHQSSVNNKEKIEKKHGGSNAQQIQQKGSSRKNEKTQKVEKMDLQINNKQQIDSQRQQQVVAQNKRRQLSVIRRQVNNEAQPNNKAAQNKQANQKPVVQNTAVLLKEVVQKQHSKFNEPIVSQIPKPEIDIEPIVPNNQLGNALGQTVLPNLLQQNIIQNQLEPQSEQENQLPPILVNLNQTPTILQIQQLTQIMKFLFQISQFETLSKIVKLLTKYEKQNMIIDGEDVNFRMNQIHVSTYQRIRKQLDAKINQLLQNDKYKDAIALKKWKLISQNQQKIDKQLISSL